MMNCHDVRVDILESVGEDPSKPSRIELDTHLAGCSECREFAAKQQALDSQLSALLEPPQLSPGFRAGLRRRIRRDAVRLWPATLPEAVHIASCGAATVACAALLPFDAVMTLFGGAGVTILSLFLLTAVRDVFEGAEEGRFS